MALDSSAPGMLGQPRACLGQVSTCLGVALPCHMSTRSSAPQKRGPPRPEGQGQWMPKAGRPWSQWVSCDYWTLALAAWHLWELTK